jgi:hypothetical protein
MRKSTIEIKSPANSPLVQLDALACLDTFVDNYEEVHIVITPLEMRVNGIIECLKLVYGGKKMVTFRCDTLVRPVDIKLEWSYYGSERD